LSDNLSEVEVLFAQFR